jgi:hypothetical protein
MTVRTSRDVAGATRNHGACCGPILNEVFHIFLGLRTVIYPAPDLDASKARYADLLERPPYFDQPFYIGFQVAGYELALDRSANPPSGPITYWGVSQAGRALARLIEAGATPDSGDVRDVGDGVRAATVREPGGSALGIIENPHFQLADSASPVDGPGRCANPIRVRCERGSKRSLPTCRSRSRYAR